jgi:hypothetical protein
MTENEHHPSMIAEVARNIASGGVPSVEGICVCIRWPSGDTQSINTGSEAAAQSLLDAAVAQPWTGY